MIADIERLLTEWFGRPVVLTTSGRIAIRLVLEQIGLRRYEHMVRVPRYLPYCVTESIIRYAFPVLEGPIDVTYVYHQFGFPQRAEITGPVIEDIAHAFYATAETGRRDWYGDYAIFSLSKWFPTAGGGGVIARTQEMADEIRGRATETVFAEMLVGLPTSIPELQRIGAERARIAKRFKDLATQHPFWDDVTVPWMIPLFPESFDDIDRDQIYHVDIARDMNHPDYRRCILHPCE